MGIWHGDEAHGDQAQRVLVQKQVGAPEAPSLGAWPPGAHGVLKHWVWVLGYQQAWVPEELDPSVHRALKHQVWACDHWGVHGVLKSQVCEVLVLGVGNGYTES